MLSLFFFWGGRGYSSSFLGGWVFCCSGMNSRSYRKKKVRLLISEQGLTIFDLRCKKSIIVEPPIEQDMYPVLFLEW
jgi:hypothetical protein